MRNPLRSLVLLVASVAATAFATPGRAQDAASLDRFVQRVAGEWSAGDVGELIDLLPPDGRMILEVGSASGPVQGRHAAAALKSLFAEGRTVSVRPSRVTVAGGTPTRGFGELTWIVQPAGTSASRTHTLYVGAVWLEGWRLSELRLLR